MGIANGSQALFRWLRTHGHDVMLGVTGGTLVATAPDAASTTLAARIGLRTDVIYLSGVYLTEERHGPGNVLA